MKKKKNYRSYLMDSISDSGRCINCSLLTNGYYPCITPIKTENIYIAVESSLMPPSQAVFDRDAVDNCFDCFCHFVFSRP